MLPLNPAFIPGGFIKFDIIMRRVRCWFVVGLIKFSKRLPLCVLFILLPLFPGLESDMRKGIFLADPRDVDSMLATAHEAHGRRRIPPPGW